MTCKERVLEKIRVECGAHPVDGDPLEAVVDFVYSLSPLDFLKLAVAVTLGRCVDRIEDWRRTK